MRQYTLNFAQAYGSGSYGDSTYSCTDQQQAAGTCSVAAGGGTSTGSGSSSGGLANTGIAVITIVTLACLIIFVALAVRIWRRKPAVQEAVAEESSPNEASTDENPQARV